MHDVTVILPPNPVLFDFVTAASIFAFSGDGYYRVRLCHSDPGPIVVHDMVSLTLEHDLAAVDAARTVVVPGVMEPLAPMPADLLDSLRRAHARGCRIASICTGAFVLAAAGLLDGRRATTHWETAAMFTDRYPEVKLDPDVLYVDDGDILTSAGVTAGIDLCLHMVRGDCGAEEANRVARRMVFGPHRDGGQAQYIERPIAPARSCRLDPTREWILERLDQPITVPQMADHACLSVRAFARRFHEETGTSPHQWVIAQRVHMARQLLEGSDLSVEQVASRCGFGSPLSFRQHFKRHVRTSPTAYRRLFRQRQEPPVLATVA
ncbi:MAG: helix-turn-helix domain-containing protein [Alphaproteobacteria bacterium]|nr:helix-turn-helix domain-containing protein [Alphaproteobacteria bacterium]